MKLEALILKGILKQIICKFAQDNFYTNAILQQAANEQMSLERTGTVISPCFLELWTRKILTLDPDKDICDQNGKPSTPLSPIPFIYYTSIPW